MDLLHFPLPADTVPGSPLRRLLRDSSRSGVLTILAPTMDWWNLPGRSGLAWIRKWGRALAPFPHAILHLPQPSPTGFTPQVELQLERALEEVRNVAPRTLTLLSASTRGDLAGQLGLSRLTHLSGVRVRSGGSRELTLPLLGMPHDRPALALIAPGCLSPWRGLHWAIGCSLGGAILRLPPTTQTLARLGVIRRFLMETAPLVGNDPAQEAVTVLLTDYGRRNLTLIENALSALARLGVAARVSTADVPLSLDKQKVILVPAPGGLTAGVVSLLLRRAHLGARVVIQGVNAANANLGLEATIAALLTRGGRLSWGRGEVEVLKNPPDRISPREALRRYRRLLAGALSEQIFQDPAGDLLVRPWRTARGWGVAAWAPPGFRGTLALPEGGKHRLTGGGGHLLAGEADQVRWCSRSTAW